MTGANLFRQEWEGLLKELVETGKRTRYICRHVKVFFLRSMLMIEDKGKQTNKQHQKTRKQIHEVKVNNLYSAATRTGPLGRKLTNRNTN